MPLLNPTFNDLDDPRLSYVPVEDGTLTRGTIKGMNEPFSPETDVQFELYTQRNTNEAQIISPLNLTSIEASNFNASNPTRYFIHGWRSSGKWTKRFVNGKYDFLMPTNSSIQRESFFLQLIWTLANTMSISSLSTGPKVLVQLTILPHVEVSS